MYRGMALLQHGLYIYARWDGYFSSFFVHNYRVLIIMVLDVLNLLQSFSTDTAMKTAYSSYEDLFTAST